MRIFQSGEGLLEVGVTEGGRGDGGDDDDGVMMSLRGVIGATDHLDCIA